MFVRDGIAASGLQSCATSTATSYVGRGARGSYLIRDGVTVNLMRTVLSRYFLPLSLTSDTSPQNQEMELSYRWVLAAMHGRGQGKAVFCFLSFFSSSLPASSPFLSS